MKRIHLESIEGGKPISEASALTVGVFDGMHKGHLSVLGRTQVTGKRLGIDSVAVTFSMHPENLLNGAAPKMIMTLEHRLRLMERAGIDKTVILPFNAETRSITAERFLKDFLVATLGLKAMVLGHDTAFGRGREGNRAFLEKRKSEYGFEVVTTEEVKILDETISSTLIREAIQSGDLGRVEDMLGRELSLYGEVVVGDRRGRQIGFPTANIDCRDAILPPNGVYAVRVLLDGIMKRGVMNIGVRPTFYEGVQKLRTVVEVHLPHFEGDLYGKELEVFIFRKIRDEVRFESVDALVRAIRADIASLER